MRALILTLLMVCATPLAAQDRQAEGASVGSLQPLNHPFLTWLLGEWEGVSEGHAGKTNDRMTCVLAYAEQFMRMEYVSEGMKVRYLGGGAYTLNRDGKIDAVWTDSFRDVTRGIGTLSDDAMVMRWENSKGKGTGVTRRVSENELEIVAEWNMADGSIVKGKTRMTRVKR
jgi:hypothetical protein